MTESTRKLESLYSLYYKDQNEKWLKSLTEKPRRSSVPEDMGAMRFAPWIEWWNSLDDESRNNFYQFWQESQIEAAVNRRSTAVDQGYGEWYHNSYAWKEPYYDEFHQRDIEILADEYCRVFAKLSRSDNSVTLANSAATGAG